MLKKLLDKTKRNWKIILLSFGLFFCSFVAISFLYAGNNDYISMKVGNTKAPYFEFSERYHFIHSFYANHGVDINKNEEFRETVRRNLAIAMTNEVLDEKIASELGVKVSSKEVEEFIENNNMLNKDFSKKAQRNITKHYLLDKKIKYKVIEDIDKSEEVIKKYYEDNKKQYTEEEVVFFTQLLYENKETATRDLSKLKSGTKVEGLTHLTEDNIIQGNISKSNQESIVEKIVFPLEEGQWSEVIELGEHYSIYRLDERKEEVVYDFEMIKEQVEKDYIAYKFEIEYQKLIDNVIKKNKVEVMMN